MIKFTTMQIWRILYKKFDSHTFGIGDAVGAVFKEVPEDEIDAWIDTEKKMGEIIDIIDQQVHGALCELKESGMVKRTERFDHGTGYVIRYRVSSPQDIVKARSKND